VAVLVRSTVVSLYLIVSSSIVVVSVSGLVQIGVIWSDLQSFFLETFFSEPVPEG